MPTDYRGDGGLMPRDEVALRPYQLAQLAAASTTSRLRKTKVGGP